MDESLSNLVLGLVILLVVLAVILPAFKKEKFQATREPKKVVLGNSSTDWQGSLIGRETVIGSDGYPVRPKFEYSTDHTVFDQEMARLEQVREYLKSLEK